MLLAALTLLALPASGQGAPVSAESLLLPSIPGLAPDATFESITSDELVRVAAPDLQGQVASGKVRFAGRTWTSGDTSVIQINATTEEAGFLQGFLRGKRKSQGPAEPLTGAGADVFIWRNFKTADFVADNVAVVRSGNVAEFIVIPAGLFTDSQLVDLALAQRARMPDSPTSTQPERIGYAIGRLIGSAAVIAGFIWLIVFVVRRVRSRRAN